VGERTGIGVVEATILEVVGLLSGPPGDDEQQPGYEGQKYARCACVLSAVEERIGLAPGYAYEVLLDLARWWKMPVPLISGLGNFGGRGGDPAAGFHFTEARLSPAGHVALSAERGEIAPMPIGLINGNTYREGTRPPFRPKGIMNAIREVFSRPHATSEEITAIIGPPDFPAGCIVTGNLTELAAGVPTDLTLQARITIDEDNRQIVIENIPPNITTGEARQNVADRAKAHETPPGYPYPRQIAGLPITNVRDCSSGDSDRLVCIAEPGTSLEQLRDRLIGVYGVSTSMPVALPRPLPDMVRGWVASHGNADILASLAALEHAIARQV
jgi:hypothetical protein